MSVSDTARLIASIELQDKMSKTLDSVNGRLGKLETTTGRAGRGIGFFGNTISTALGVGLQRAVSSGIGLFTSSLAAGQAGMEKLQVANAQTQAALKSTGGAAGQTAQGIREMSNRLEDLNATIDDKVIQSAANLLLSFTNIKGKAFEPTLKAALDLNQRLGGGEEGLQGNLIKVAKAMNDPLKGLGLLARVGVTFSAAEKTQIADLIKHNNLYGAQQIVLSKLSTTVGGSFAAAGKTAAGQAASLHDKIEELQISLDEGLAPGLSNVRDALIRTFADPSTKAGVAAFGKSISDFLSPGNIRTGIGIIKDSFSTIKNVVTSVPWGAIGKALELGGKGAKAILDAFNAAPSWVQTAVLTGWGLNKLTGGAIGSIFGNIAGKGISAVIDIFKGRGSTPANPLFVADVAGGAGGPGGLVAGLGKGGFLSTVLKAAGVTLIGAAIGDAVGQFLNEHQILGIGGSVTPAKNFEAAGFQQVTSRGSAADIERAIRSIEDNLNPKYFGAQVALALDINGVRSTLESQLATLQANLPAVKAAELKMNVAAAIAAHAQARTADGISNVNIHTLAAANATKANLAAINQTAARTHSYLSRVASSDASTANSTAVVAKKNFSPTVNVGVNVTSVLNVNAVQRAIVANSIRMTRLGVL